MEGTRRIRPTAMQDSLGLTETEMAAWVLHESQLGDLTKVALMAVSTMCLWGP